MMNSTTPKYIFLGLIAAMFLCFVMGGVTLRQEIARRLQTLETPTPARRPSPFTKAPRRDYPSSPSAPASATPMVQSLAKIEDFVPKSWQPPPPQMLGRWQGNAATTTGFFFFWMEITTDTRHPNQLLGFVKAANMQLPTPRLGLRQPTVKELIEQRIPHQLALVGTPSDDGSVAFHVTNAVGPQGDCPITDIRVSLWGTEGIAADWRGTACPGGSMVLARQP